MQSTAVMRDAALGYAQLGWKVAPVKPGEKHPLIKDYIQEASKNERKIERWWSDYSGAWIAIITGGPSGILVLDADPPGGEKSLATLEKRLGPLPETYSVRTPRGGRHLYFRLPPKEAAVVKNSTSKIAENIDIRAEGGCVIAPPAKGYEIERPLEDYPLVMPPPQWIQVMTNQGKELKVDKEWEERAKTEKNSAYGEKALYEECMRLARAPYGTRNDTLNRVAFLLAQLCACDHLKEDRALNQIRDAARYCGLAEDEPEATEKTLASGWKAGFENPRENPPSPSAVPMKLIVDRTDTGNAIILAKLFGDQIRYDHNYKRWLIWNRHYWLADPDEQITRMALKGAEYRQRQLHSIEDDGTAKKVASWVRQSRQGNTVNSTLRMARAIYPISVSGQDWDGQPYLLACDNGVVDLETGELRPGRQEDLISQHVTYNFDANAKCPEWEKFVSDIMLEEEDMIRFLQRSIGYSITGLASEQAFWILHGNGSNGKDLLLNVMMWVLQDYAYTTSFVTFAESGKAMPGSHAEELANLIGKRFVAASETQKGIALNEARIKNLTDGGAVTTRAIRSKEVTFQSQASLWLAVNDLPLIRDDSDGFWRRTLLMRLRRQFKDPKKCDELDLPRKREMRQYDYWKDEIPGILAWCVRGAQHYFEEGLKVPERIQTEVEGFRVDSDPIQEFIDDCTNEDPRGFAPLEKLYSTYHAHCDHQGMPKKERMEYRDFGIALSKRYKRSRRRIRRGENPVTGYIGLNLEV